MSRATTLALPRTQKKPIIERVQQRHPRRFLNPPAHTRALRVRRTVQLPSEQLTGLLTEIKDVFPRTHRNYRLGELALTLFESSHFMEADWLMSPNKLTHFKGTVEERLKQVGGFAVKDAVVNPFLPVDSFGRQTRPRVALRLSRTPDLLEDAIAVNEVVRRELGLEPWDSESFEPHISFVIARSEGQGAEIAGVAGSYSSLPRIIAMNGVKVISRLDEEL